MQSYVEVTADLQKELAAVHPPSLNTDKEYSIPWILRSRLVTMLGLKQEIAIPARMTLDDLQGAFPDANDWLDRFVKSAPKSKSATVNAFMKYLGFRLGGHLLTMYFCLLGDCSVQKFSVEFIKQHETKLRQRLKKYMQDNEVLPHPGVLLTDFKKEMEKESKKNRTMHVREQGKRGRRHRERGEQEKQNIACEGTGEERTQRRGEGEQRQGERGRKTRRDREQRVQRQRE